MSSIDGDASGASRPVPAAPRPAAPRRWLVAPTVGLAAFMEVLDISIANVALQHIAGSLAASQEEATWVLTSYLVANAIVLPMTGWISMIMGRKRFYLASIVVFTVSSMLCGLAPSLGWLIFFRVVQGLGGGVLLAEDGLAERVHIHARAILAACGEKFFQRAGFRRQNDPAAVVTKPPPHRGHDHPRPHP